MSNINKAYTYNLVCKTKGCQYIDVESEKLHTDDFESCQWRKHKKLSEYNIGAIVEVEAWAREESICTCCGFRKELINWEETEEYSKPYLHGNLQFSTEDRKRSPSFYTRWHDGKGGKPGFNPVSGTGSPSGKKTLD